MKSWQLVTTILIGGGFGTLLFSARLDGGVRTVGPLLQGSRSLDWFGLRITVEPGMVLDVRNRGADHRLDVRAGFGGGQHGRLGEQLMTFGFKETSRTMVPSHEWTPCSGCERFQDTLSNGLSLECFRQEQPIREHPYQVVGCRSVQNRLVVLYRCPIHLPRRCAGLKHIRNTALESFRPSNDEPAPETQTAARGTRGARKALDLSQLTRVF